MNFKKIFCIFSFLILATSVFSQINLSDAKKTGVELRLRAMEEYRDELAKASLKEISPENLGGWNEILSTTLFMLIRKTELYRGRMRLMIEETDKAKCKIYPDGTILISTALFDYIDTRLANIQNLSPRKIKNFNIEREKILASFIVHQVANFVEESKLLKFSKDKTFSLEELKINNLRTDEFAVVILRLAGYNASLFYDYLEELNRIQRDPMKVKNFSFFFEEQFDPQTRISNLLKKITNSEVMADEISGILESIQNGSLSSLEDAKQKIIAMQNEFPTNIYFKRLTTIIFDKAWRYNLKNMNEALFPSYSISMHGLNSVKEYFSILNSDYQNLQIKQIVLSKYENQPLVSIKEYDEAIRAYQSYLSLIEEGGVLSSYALLLSCSNNLAERLNALEFAKKAYLMEHNTESGVAALNYASLLYSSGQDYTAAKIIFESRLNENERVKSNSLFLRTGTMIDERILLYNYSRALFGLGQVNEAKVLKEKLKLILFPLDEYEAMPLKQISLGSTTDELIDCWGEPPLIQYNYFLETWVYDFLKASVVISQNEGNTIEKIIIHLNSNLTMPDDLRVGETKKAFEKTFGELVYYSGDLQTYFYKGNKIQIFYANNYAREVIISRL